MRKNEGRKQHCITLNEEATRQLAEGAARAHLPKNLFIEKLLREEDARFKNNNVMSEQRGVNRD